jgi:hypothetical protein
MRFLKLTRSNEPSNYYFVNADKIIAIIDNSGVTHLMFAGDEDATLSVNETAEEILEMLPCSVRGHSK